MATHRLFFALSPPPAIRSRLARAAQGVTKAQRAPGRATATSQLHLTLAYLGEFPDHEAAARARAAGERVRAATFTLEIDQAGSFGPTWFLAIDSPPAALVALHEALGAELVREGFTLEARAFHPHVTFQRGAEHALPPTRVRAIRWEVEAFALLDSFPGEQRYLTLAEWPLVAPGQPS